MTLADGQFIQIAPVGMVHKLFLYAHHIIIIHQSTICRLCEITSMRRIKPKDTYSPPGCHPLPLSNPTVAQNLTSTISKPCHQSELSSQSKLILMSKTPAAVEIKPFKGALEGPQFGKQNLSDVAQDLQEKHLIK